MIVYNDLKGKFVKDVREGLIADMILDRIHAQGLGGGEDREFEAWKKSLTYMCDVIDTGEIRDDVSIAIEYNIPLTSKRVDFIISGADGTGRDHIVIVELKQWTSATIPPSGATYCVRTWVANDYRIVCHPSYQAYSYSRLISNFSPSISSGDVDIHPSAYLHNFEKRNKPVLEDGIYKEWFERAPFFIEDESGEFRKFIMKHVTQRSSRGDLLFMIDHGRLKPSKSLQDSLNEMVSGNPVFDPIDEQAACFDICTLAMKACRLDGRKRTVIIKGGPGTGKSVVAINLLNRFIGEGLLTSYVTKNSSPRNAFRYILSNGNAMRDTDIKRLFRSPFGMHKVNNNTYDCLLVDEAHRLVPSMYRDFGGVNQVKECIQAARLSVFFLDEDQAVTINDIGTVDEIRRWCSTLGSELIMNENTELHSQFRCNGSDEFIQFVDLLLQKKQGTLPHELHFDFQIFSDPSSLREELRKKNAENNRSRMVAGYCYDWNLRHHRRGFLYDIYLPGGFQAKWNLEDDDIWAINPNSFEEVGCIHTAQGLEFEYVGVLIGKDLRYDKSTKTIITDKTAISKDDRSSGIRTANDDDARRLILNTYKTLMTRGMKGCFVYCEDEALKEYFESMKAIVQS